MTETTWEELNNIPEMSAYIEFPIDFTGKSKDGRSTAFAGLLLSAQFILAEIHTMNKIYKEAAKLTYDHFVIKFGMSRETVGNAINVLIKLNIIECVKRSRYIIKATYRKKDYVEIDNYWIKRLWNVNGKEKRLSRSRLLTLALLKRGAENPKTDGKFISSQGRIGKALNLPKTTAGDSIREIINAGLIKCEKQDGNDSRKRGCSLYTVNPQILKVKHHNIYAASAKILFGITEPTPEELHARLMLDLEYMDIVDRININYAAKVSEVIKAKGEDTPKLAKLEAETSQLRGELESYFTRHRINRKVFPPGFFRTDINNGKF